MTGTARWNPRREIVAPVALCSAAGLLEPDAVGWSRVPLHTFAGLRARWPRAKRWNHWCVSSRDWVCTITVADVGYMGLGAAFFRDHHQPARDVVCGWATPLALGVGLDDPVFGDPIVFSSPSLRIKVIETANATHLSVRNGSARRKVFAADLQLAKPPSLETLNVVIPWNEREYQFTSKHVGRAVEGQIACAGVTHRVDASSDAFGFVDIGRGVWPYRTAWNWAAGAARDGERVVGFNLGGRWTDGTGATENGLFVGGRLHKLHGDVRFHYDVRHVDRPWDLTDGDSARVALRFTPRNVNRVRAELGVAATRLQVAFGRFDGWIADDSGAKVAFRDVPGWAEDHRARW